ncbi:TCR gamma alternate reading frame protein [Echinops telfairi]|uniref:TCR gamma alternate reading frame protein n=1 Tax=Echinops telfairi TaxID=9371 RepID=UPI001E1D497D|nr:TCR gamma alternate reading frame protein [Echinops telfairi]
MPVLEALVFSFLWAFGLAQLKLEQPALSISKATRKSAHITCKVSSGNFANRVIYWYRLKPNQAIEYLIGVLSTSTPAQVSLGKKSKTLEASKNVQTSTSILKINYVEKEDEAMYYCAGWVKIFAEGTKLIVTSSDKGAEANTPPKPTIFLPSVAERKLDDAGTYLCLLEDFFPDVIKVDWKEKGSDAPLGAQQGDIMQTPGDAFMKFSWLTVSGESLNKEHQCVVKHETGVEEILFPSIKKGFTLENSTKPCLKGENDTLRLQLTNTSAFYTYLLLLLKSAVYSATVAFYLLRRADVWGPAKSS